MSKPENKLTSNDAAEDKLCDAKAMDGDVSVSFSLRFLLTLSLVIALVLGVVGFVGRDWAFDQQLKFLATICIWSLLVGLCLYVALWRRRDMNSRLGPLRLRVGGTCSTRLRRGLASAGAAIVFAAWTFSVAIYIDDDERWVVQISFIAIALTLAEVRLLYGLLAQPGALEFYERGLYALQTGQQEYRGIKSWFWANEHLDILYIVIVHDAEAISCAIAIPPDDLTAVDQNLRRYLPDGEVRND